MPVHVIAHAAATRRCDNASSTIKMKRPTFEETNASLPHWMRRQIGAVVPLDKLARPATGGWTFETTRCVAGPQILQDWAAALGQAKVRPHVLKVDVEGHDFEVSAAMGPHMRLYDPSGSPLSISFSLL